MEFIKLRKFSTKQKNTNKTKISLWQDFSIFGSQEIRHLHALNKTARCGASPHQLLRPPDPLSLSSRSPMTADIIDVLKWYKLGHFIKQDGEPNCNLKKCYNQLRQNFSKKISLQYINFIFKCSKFLLDKLMTNQNFGNNISRDFFVENFLGFTDTISFYNKISHKVFTPNVHPCLKKWNSVHIPGLKINNRKILTGLKKLFSIQTCFRHLKYAHELLLCSFRTEKHLIHFPDHPTKSIRTCNACLGVDSINHIFLACPLAQCLWLRFKLIVQCIIGQSFEVTKELIFLNLNKTVKKCNKSVNRLIASLACAVKYTIANTYYKRAQFFNFEDVEYTFITNIKSVFLLYSQYNINIPTKVIDILSGRHELCNGQIYEFLIKIRSAFYQRNIDIDSTPRIYEFFTTSYNSKGKKLEINFEYIKYCLRNIYDDNLITRNPVFFQSVYH